MTEHLQITKDGEYVIEAFGIHEDAFLKLVDHLFTYLIFRLHHPKHPCDEPEALKNFLATKRHLLPFDLTHPNHFFILGYAFMRAIDWVNHPNVQLTGWRKYTPKPRQLPQGGTP